jgi:four helix bundle protein
VALQVAEALTPIIAAIAQHDPDLAKQVRKAQASVVLNLAEGACRTGRDRNHHYRVASGSAAEARGGVRLALVWQYITREMAAAAEPHLDRQAAVLYRLVNPKR